MTTEPISLAPLPTEQLLALPEREQQLNAIGDVIAYWLQWVTRERDAAGLTTVPDTHVMFGYDGAPPEWPRVGQLLKWLEVLREGVSDGWQAIESAPKDRAVILYCGPKARYRIIVGRWNERFGWQSEPGGWPARPSHWMPKPEEPR